MARYFQARWMVHKAVVILMVCKLNTLLANGTVTENATPSITTERVLNSSTEPLSTSPTVTPSFNSSSTPTEILTTDEQVSDSSDVITTPVWFTTPTQPIESSTEPQLGGSTIIYTETVESSTTEQPETSTFISSTTNTPYISSVTPTATFNFTTEQLEHSTFTLNTTNTPLSTFVTLTETYEDLTTEQPDSSTLISNTTNTPISSPVTPTQINNFTTVQPDNSTFIANTTNTPISSPVTPTQINNFTTVQPDNSTFIANTTNTPISSPVTPTQINNFTTVQPDNSTFIANTTNTPFSSPVTPTQINNFTTIQPDNSTFIANTTNTPISSPVTPTQINNFTTIQPDNSTFIANTTNTPSSNFTTPAFETSTSEQVVTGTFFTPGRTKMTTNLTPEQTTRLSSLPSQEATTSGPTDTPNVPGDQPPIFKNDPEKTIRVEIAISETSTSCRPESNSSSKHCEALMENFKSEVKALYSLIDGFLRVDTLRLSKGSVIIRHNAVYNFTAMTPEDQRLTGEQVFDRTVGKAVTDLGNLTVVECKNCNRPEACLAGGKWRGEIDHPWERGWPCPDKLSQYLSNFCSLISQGLATCADNFLQPQCVNGYVICRSPCKGTPDYCNERGVCSQASNAEPVCQCVDTTERWYSGLRCEVYVDIIWVIVGVCFGAGFLIIVVAIVLYLCCRRCQNSNLSPRDRGQSFLSGDEFDGEVYMLNCHTIEDGLDPVRSGPSNHATAFTGGHDGPTNTFGKKEEGENEYVDLNDESRRPQPRITSYYQDVPVVQLCMEDFHASPGGLDAAAANEDSPPTPKSKAMENIYF